MRVLKALEHYNKDCYEFVNDDDYYDYYEFVNDYYYDDYYDYDYDYYYYDYDNFMMIILIIHV